MLKAVPEALLFNKCKRTVNFCVEKVTYHAYVNFCCHPGGARYIYFGTIAIPYDFKPKRYENTYFQSTYQCIELDATIENPFHQPPSILCLIRPKKKIKIFTMTQKVGQDQSDAMRNPKHYDAQTL